MKILVTGSTGFIGSQLCRALVEAGHHVLAFHRASSSLGALEGLPDCSGPDQPGCLEHIIGDVTQPETLPAALQGVEAVFHTAGLVSASAQPGRLYAVNVEGTRALLEAARTAGVRRVVFTSSASALGVPLSGPAPVDERHTWNFIPQHWPYAYTKYQAELEIQKSVATGQDVVIVNPSLVFGAGDIYNASRSILARAADRQVGFVTEGGLNVVHIRDVVAGHLAALEKGRRGERYLLCGQNLTHLELLQIASAAAGVPAPTLVLPAGLVRSLAGPLHLLQSFIDLPVSPSLLPLAGYYFYYDGSKARGDLGLPEPRPAEEAIREALEWLMEQRSNSRPNAGQSLKTVPLEKSVGKERKSK
ncbi:nucleoside-diphosphate-sugar epimerase [Longilinea arvoryzae]|uniref:Nucleoside-diphosphate-sugar epimerase n=1 Tax=Longilinea arvoryzae TaxID=360412 RepID=A0A0S7BF68_9CHLR|nr:NAD-dependent epimerase/dehydratase family protein [Longilinea arvoryzae]GAP13110.1 nucleoside-diphosphate-sugar epimerase [Longilinea arvoryzae]